MRPHPTSSRNPRPGRIAPRPRRGSRLVVAVVVLALGAGSATGCVGKLGRNDDKVQPGSKGPSAANQ